MRGNQDLRRRLDVHRRISLCSSRGFYDIDGPTMMDLQMIATAIIPA